MKTRPLVIALVLTAAIGRTSAGGTPVPDEAAIRSAVARSLPLLVAGSEGSTERRKQCFTCHGQGAAIRALAVAGRKGVTIDEEPYKRQVQFVADFLEKHRPGFAENRGPGGRVLTVGSALWALEAGESPPSPATEAAVAYLLKYQSDLDHWKPDTSRPPSERSHFASSYVALRALKTFGTPDQQERIAARVRQVSDWVRKTPAEETEDRVFRLWCLQVVGATADEIDRAAQDLLQTQREDGGWSQLPEMASDPYATGSALVALYEAAGVSSAHAAYAGGVKFLLESQLADGSWHVVTRSKPIQTYFESGYPHGPDQFISMAAAGWATTALALALPDVAEKPAESKVSDPSD